MATPFELKKQPGKYVLTMALTLIACMLFGQTAMAKGSATIHGNWAGHTLTPHSAVYYLGGAPGRENIIIVITDAPGACEDMQRSILRCNSTILQVHVGGTGAGTYPVASSMYNNKVTHGEAKALLARLDGECRPLMGNTIEEHSEHGTLTLHDIARNPVLRGDFAIAFGLYGDVVSGKFAAAYCQLPHPPTMEAMQCH